MKISRRYLVSIFPLSRFRFDRAGVVYYADLPNGQFGVGSTPAEAIADARFDYRYGKMQGLQARNS